MTNTKSYLAVGAAVFAGNIAYNMALDSRISSMEDHVFEMQTDIEVIKDAVLERHAGRINYSPKEFECMVRNIYYEAGVENDLGKYAVAQVTLNRKKTGYWGKNICNVVYSKAQFSWTKVKERAWLRPKDATWVRCRKIATDVLNDGVRVKPLRTAVYYHATYINDPQWVDYTKKLVTIGQHVFYSGAKNTNISI